MNNNRGKKQHSHAKHGSNSFHKSGPQKTRARGGDSNSTKKFKAENNPRNFEKQKAEKTLLTEGNFGLSAHEREYLETLLTTINNPEETAQVKEKIIDAIFEEFKDKARKLAVERVGESFVANLLAYATQQQIVHFFNLFEQYNYTNLAIHSTGSRVLELFLDKCAELMAAAPNKRDTPEIYHLLKKLAVVVQTSPKKFLQNQTASFIFRKLVMVLSGAKKAHGNFPLTSGERIQVYEGCPALLQRIAKAYFQLPPKKLTNYIKNQSGSLCFQILLELLPDPSELCSLILKNTSLPNLIQSTGGPYLAQGLTLVCSESEAEEFLQFLRPKLKDYLATKTNEYFIVLSLISGTKSEKMALQVFQDLEPHLKQLQHWQFGLLERFSEKARSLTPKLQPTLIGLAEAQVAKMAGLVFLNLIKDGQKFSLQGAQLLKQLFEFKEIEKSKIVQSMKKMSPGEIGQVVRDPSASRAFQQFLRSPHISESTKSVLIQLLEGQFWKLAISSVTSFVVSDCYKYGNMESKSKLCSELLAHETQLLAQPCGRAVAHSCDLKTWKGKTPEQVLASLQSQGSQKQKKIDLFRDIIQEPANQRGDDNTQTAKSEPDPELLVPTKQELLFEEKPKGEQVEPTIDSSEESSDSSDSSDFSDFSE